MEGTLELTGNVGAAQMLTGYTGYSNNPKSKISGSMANRGAVSQQLSINGTYTIPAGYHNGSGKVTQSIPTQGAKTVTPGKSDQTAVSSGRYCSGNITVKGDSNLVAGNIKKGVKIFGIIGTWEGWVPTATDLYLRGNNPAGFSIVDSPNSNRFGAIKLLSSKSYDLSPYSKLNIECNFDDSGYGGNAPNILQLYVGSLSSNDRKAVLTGNPDNFLGSRTISLGISDLHLNGKIGIVVGNGSYGFSGYIFRIWLS